MAHNTVTVCDTVTVCNTMTAPAVAEATDAAIIYRNTGYGLSRDAELLQTQLTALGLTTTTHNKNQRGWRHRIPFLSRKKTIAHTAIHLERVYPAWLSAAEQHILIPNQERFPRRHLHRLKHIHRVWTKTKHAQNIFAALGCNTTHIGFTSPDKQDPTVPRQWDKFFHLAGGSTLKGTEAILQVWEQNPQLPQLVLVQKQNNAPKSVPRNVTLLAGYLSDDELTHHQNECGIHLCPSQAEGWGHNIVESLSCGAVVVTTDAPPMNEHITPQCGHLVAASESEPRHLGQTYAVDIKALTSIVVRLAALPETTLSALGTAARAQYETIRHTHTTHLQTAVRELQLK